MVYVGGGEGGAPRWWWVVLGGGVERGCCQSQVVMERASGLQDDQYALHTYRVNSK